jgi:hypothetical protein
MHATNPPIRRAENGKNQENAIRRATNSRIRRARKGKNRENSICRATNSRIRRAEVGKSRQKWAVCAMRATNRQILCAAWVTNGQSAIWLAHNPAILSTRW